MVLVRSELPSSQPSPLRTARPELVQLLVERVRAKERVTDPATIEWTPPARPFFGKVRGYGAPGRTQAPDSHAVLDYYLEVV